MRLIIYWFRNDLRLEDNPAFLQACADADYLLPIAIKTASYQATTKWGFERVSSHRQKFENESLLDLKTELQRLGSDLFVVNGEPSNVFANFAAVFKDLEVYCQQIEAPEEKEEILKIKKEGISVHNFWQSSMLDPSSLPFALDAMPDVFTHFRKEIEASKLRFASPRRMPGKIPPLPTNPPLEKCTINDLSLRASQFFKGGSQYAKLHVDQYFERRLPDTYKQTRNQLEGMDFSSKFSPWLATGCISARSIAQRINAYEEAYGANEGTYWLWFEMLWRDYFEFLAFKYGTRLFHGNGLTQIKSNSFDSVQFDQWRTGQTKSPFVNAGMTELAETGFLSNRMRQIVASYWVYDMHGDWQAGAAWFESQLIDYDVYSNQGNWLYIAGKGTDPRGGRPFNVLKQQETYDPDGKYRAHWLKNA